MRNRIFFIVAFFLLGAGSVSAQQGKDSLRVQGHRTFGIDCMQCHTTASWSALRNDIAFDHKLSGYALRGNHASVACASCHSGVPMSEMKTACASCHEDQHKGELGDKCGDCHTPAGWRSERSSREASTHAVSIARFARHGGLSRLPPAAGGKGIRQHADGMLRLS